MLTNHNKRASGLQSLGDLTVIYDGECPFCRSYVSLMKLRNAVGSVSLIDAREKSSATRELTHRGYDLNQGMAVIYGETIYFGKDAVVLISSLINQSGVTSKLIAVLLREPRRAALFYPMMKMGRRITLNLLGKPPLDI